MKRHSSQMRTVFVFKASFIALSLACSLPVFAAESEANKADSSQRQATAGVKDASHSCCQEMDSPSLSTAPLSCEPVKVDESDEGKSPLATDSPVYKAIAERYFSYHKALLKAKSLKELLPYRMQVFQEEFKKKMAPGVGKGMDNPDTFLPIIQAMEPRSIKITQILIKDDWAQLHAEGLDAGDLIEGMNKGLNKIGEDLAKALGNKSEPGKEKTITLGSVQFHLENGLWQIGKESWNSKTTTVNKDEPGKN